MEVKPIGDKKQAFELSPIVKISLTLNFATSPEGGSVACRFYNVCRISGGICPRSGSDCRNILVRRWKL